MRFHRRRKVPDAQGLTEARQARLESENRFWATFRDLTEPLREMRETNHITEDVRKLIEKRVEEGRG